MPRKAPLYPGVKAPIQKKPSRTARAAAAAPATPSQTESSTYDSKCQRAADALVSNFKVQPARANVVRGALQAAYAKRGGKDEPLAKLKMFMSKVKSNPEYLQLVTEATSADKVENLVHRAMFERFFAAPQAKARYDHQTAVALEDRKVTMEHHAIVGDAELIRMADFFGKGSGNQNKYKDLEELRQRYV